MYSTDEMVQRFLQWELPRDFSPDCGVAFDGRPADARGYARQWPTGTNLLTAEQARAMLDFVIGKPKRCLTIAQCKELVAEHFEHGQLTGDDMTLIRAVENAHGIAT